MTLPPAFEKDNDSSLIISAIEGDIGWITLNRDKALNSLNHEMIRTLQGTLEAWEKKETVRAVVLQGKGRAFCAGGDVRDFYFSKMEGRLQEALQFFKEEYQLNAYIKHYPKPYLSLINGIAMGGGLGISVHGSHRLVTEKALIAMPETTIGYFPDVGGTYFLSRMEKNLGLYLGLTGEHIKPEDALYAGIATHYTSSNYVSKIIEDLKTYDLKEDPHSQIDLILERHSLPVPTSHFKKHADLINFCFSADSIEEILINLKQEGSAFALKTIETLKSKSPTSLKVVLKALLLARELDFNGCMQQEFQMATEFVTQHDFTEGIRALLVEKDKKPHWQPSSLKEVSPSAVDKYFETSGSTILPT